MRDREGPKVDVRMSCFDCKWVTSVAYRVQGDSGCDVYCTHPSLGRKEIGDSSWNTPHWCPVNPQSEADTLRARLTELEAERDKARSDLVALSSQISKHTHGPYGGSCWICAAVGAVSGEARLVLEERSKLVTEVGNLSAKLHHATTALKTAETARAELGAEAAGMRGAMAVGPCQACVLESPHVCDRASAIKRALEGTAGKAILEELAVLREVAEAARYSANTPCWKWTESRPRATGGCKNKSPDAPCGVCLLRAALARLDSRGTP